MSKDVDNLIKLGYKGGLPTMRSDFLRSEGYSTLFDKLKAEGYTGALSDMLQQRALTVGLSVSEFNKAFGEVCGKELRDFRTNSGTTDYVQLASPVTLSGDFEITVFLVPDTSSMHILANTAGVSRVWTNSTSLEISATSGYVRFPNVLTMGKLNEIIVKRVSGVVSLSVNGVVVSASTSNYLANSVVFNSIGGKILSTGVGVLDGIVADISVLNADVITNSWAIDDNSNTIVDSVGGNNGTIINGQASDWELFERLPGANFWTGTTSGRILEIA